MQRGRKLNHDPRSRGYAYTALPHSYTSVIHERHVPIFDQGDMKACTGYAAIGCMATGAFWKTTLGTVPFFPLDPAGALAAYSAATFVDPFPETWPPQDTGSDGNSVAKALRNAEMINGWKHAFSFKTAMGALQHWPLLFGCNWYEGMNAPDELGTITVSGALLSGHEVILTGYDALAGKLKITNSWGPEWGVGGSAWIGVTDFARLMHENGDVTIFVPR